MAVPARKTSKARKNKICGNCGYYNGKEVISKEA